jgi:hypothetical protein
VEEREDARLVLRGPLHAPNETVGGQDRAARLDPVRESLVDRKAAAESVEAPPDDAGCDQAIGVPLFEVEELAEAGVFLPLAAQGIGFDLEPRQPLAEVLIVPVDPDRAVHPPHSGLKGAEQRVLDEPRDASLFMPLENHEGEGEDAGDEENRPVGATGEQVSKHAGSRPRLSRERPT